MDIFKKSKKLKTSSSRKGEEVEEEEEEEEDGDLEKLGRKETWRKQSTRNEPRAL